MAVKNMLYFDLGSAYDLLRPTALLLHRELLQFEEVPNTDSLVEGATRDESVLGMELGAHHIVGVTGQDGQLVAILPVPDADGLIVRA